jgi:hypothetical protein
LFSERSATALDFEEMLGFKYTSGEITFVLDVEGLAAAQHVLIRHSFRNWRQSWDFEKKDPFSEQHHIREDVVVFRIFSLAGFEGLVFSNIRVLMVCFETWKDSQKRNIRLDPGVVWT